MLRLRAFRPSHLLVRLRAFRPSHLLVRLRAFRPSHLLVRLRAFRPSHLLAVSFRSATATLVLSLILGPGLARAIEPSRTEDRDAKVRAAAKERAEGCWLQAEEKLLSVVSSAEAGDAHTRALAELSQLYTDRGDPSTGEALAREAAESASGDGARAHALRSLIIALSRTAPYDNELPETIERLARITDAPPRDPVARALTMRLQASYAHQRGRPAEAVAISRNAEALLAEAAPQSIERGSALAILVASVSSANDAPRGIEIGEVACGMLRRLAPEGLFLAQCLNNLAICRAEEGDLHGALSDFEESLAVRERLAPGSPESVRVLPNMASLLVRAGDLVRAEEYARRAVALLRGDGRITPLERLRGVIEASGRPFLETEVLCEMADLIEARSLSNMPDGVRQRIREWEGHLTFLLGNHLARLGLPEEALDAIERARARGLLLAQAEGQRRQGSERRNAPNLPKLRAAYESGLKRLSELDAGAGRAQRDAAQAELFALRVRIELLTTETARAPQATRSLTTSEIRERLEEGTLALVYARGARVFALRRGRPVFTASLAVTDAELEGKIRRLQRLVTRSSETGPSPALLDAGRELSCLLLEPVSDLLAEARRLVICSDDLVARVPFGALVVGDSGAVEGKEPRYLAERMPLSQTPSMTALFAGPPRNRSPLDTELWSVGDPDTASPGMQLPGARAEALSIAALHPGPARVLLGSAAQEGVVKGISAAAGTLHLACHATANASRPEDSALLLARPAPGSTDNGELRAWEVSTEMSLDADLVVLSACTSSSAVDNGVEGPLGLARAFQIAGARRVLAARWRVPDEPTALFMEAFYSARARGLAADRCLQEAQVALRSKSETAHPYYWAGFVLHGDGR